MKKNITLLLLYFLLTKSSQAQLCTGSLGDPVVNITFGNDNTPRGPLKPGVTNMTYTTGCPNDGQYGITNLSFGCFGNTWFLLAGDHTGDTGGRFMVINASYDPSDFYVDTVSGLCGNTLYQFAAWASNILKPDACGGNGIKPNLSFSIESLNGTVIKKISSGDIASGNSKTWNQYGTFFQTPQGTGTVVLRITNNSPGGCGNDLILDDITFRACGPQIKAYVVNDSSSYINICENDKVDIAFNASYSVGFTDPVLQWQVSRDTGKTWTDITGEQGLQYTRKPTAKGRFQYRAVIAERGNFGSVQCRIASNVTDITVNPAPPPPLVTAVTGCIGSPVVLETISGSDFTYQWSGPNGFTSTIPYTLIPSVQPSDAGLYKVTVNMLGCSRTDSIQLNVFPGVKASVIPVYHTCEGSGLVLSASGGSTYVWSPSTHLNNINSANPIASPIDTISYKVVVSNQYGCKDSAITLVNVWKKPIVNAGPDKFTAEGVPVQLDGSVAGTDISFNWSPNSTINNTNTLRPMVTPVDNTTYTLTGISNPGCGIAADEVIVKVYKKVKVPNIFSPNGDGINDTWVVTSLDTYPDALLQVFSREGRVVFQTRSNDKIWDGTFQGKPLPVATYYYVIDLHNGESPVSGWVVLVR